MPLGAARAGAYLTSVGGGVPAARVLLVRADVEPPLELLQDALLLLVIVQILAAETEGSNQQAKDVGTVKLPLWNI